MSPFTGKVVADRLDSRAPPFSELLRLSAMPAVTVPTGMARRIGKTRANSTMAARRWLDGVWHRVLTSHGVARRPSRHRIEFLERARLRRSSSGAFHHALGRSIAPMIPGSRCSRSEPQLRSFFPVSFPGTDRE